LNGENNEIDGGREEMLIEERRGEGGDAMNEAMEEIGDQEDK